MTPRGQIPAGSGGQEAAQASSGQGAQLTDKASHPHRQPSAKEPICAHIPWGYLPGAPPNKPCQLRALREPGLASWCLRQRAHTPLSQTRVGWNPEGRSTGRGRVAHIIPSLVLGRDVQATLSAQLLAASFVVGDPVLQVRGQLRGLHLKGRGQ